MSVYIKGMEMPKSCGYCPFRYRAMEGDECMFNVRSTEYQKRPDDCPLIPVPDHGRLIDADEFCKEHRNQSLILKIGWRRFYWHIAAAGFVDDAPTIIPASKEE